MNRLQRLAITCGGTGGHFYPGLATAIAAEKRGIPVLLLLSGIIVMTHLLAMISIKRWNIADNTRSRE